MPLVPFRELMAEAARGKYAVGYFESWNLESLLAAADAAVATRSPVLLGFSGIYLPHPERAARDPLALYSALGLEVCRDIPVPACLVFNESPHLDWVMEAIRQRFGLVMFTEESVPFGRLADTVCFVASEAHQAGLAAEAELLALPGVGGELAMLPSDLRLTDPAQAQEFVQRTGVDALAVNVGQAHVHGRMQARLNLARLADLAEAVPVPLVLHGASSVASQDIQAAIDLGVRKINVGSVLKRTYFEALRSACADVGMDYNPYEVIGSGLAGDVLMTARLALQARIEEMMRLFGSAGQAVALDPGNPEEERVS